MNDLPKPNFPGIALPTTDFSAVRSQLRTQPLYTTVDLTTARAKSANSELVLSIGGNFIYCDPALSSGVATGYFMSLDGKATPITLYPGAAFDVPFTSLTIENTAQTGASLRLIYGTDIAFRPANAAGVSILNAISVIDSSKARTQNGQAFIGKTVSGASVGNFSHAQLRNGTSSYRAVIEQIWVGSSVATDFTIIRYDTALGAYGFGMNKLVGAADSQCALLAGTNAAALGTGQVAANLYSPASQMTLVPLREPIILNPGIGIIARPGAANTSVLAAFEWFEENYP